MRLLLARHGESVWNEVRRFQGSADVALSERGRAQARALSRGLRGYRLAAAYVSPLARARETAELALAGREVPIRPLPELREMSLGEWEGCDWDEIRGREGDPYRAWVRAPLDCPPPGAEPLPSVHRRVLDVIDRIAVDHTGEDVLVVAHGGVISVYACHLLGCSFNALWRLRVDNASLTIAEPPRLVTLNDTSHLVGLEVIHLTSVEGPSAVRAPAFHWGGSEGAAGPPLTMDSEGAAPPPVVHPKGAVEAPSDEL